MDPNAWCKCCDGLGLVPEIKVCYSFHSGISVVETGYDKACPACDMTKVSARAHQWRKDNNYISNQ